jgi:hypothetical protein
MSTKTGRSISFFFTSDILAPVKEINHTYKQEELIFSIFGFRQLWCNRGARYLTGENLEVVWVEFSTLS